LFRDFDVALDSYSFAAGNFTSFVHILETKSRYETDERFKVTTGTVASN